MSELDKTIREQVIDDITMATEITTEIMLPNLSGKKKKELSYTEYFMFLEIVMNHIHYVFDQIGYVKTEENKTSIEAI